MGKCNICDKELGDAVDCFDCFVNLRYTVSVQHGDGTATFYQPPPVTPEKAMKCDWCGRFMQFAHFSHEMLTKLGKSDSVIPQVCNLGCLGLHLLEQNKKQEAE